ncbi:MAG: class I SAM-dependent methyltransferase [Draconibacterium sp.]
MEQKETYWSRFADDFEERNFYVAGRRDVECLLQKVSALKDLKKVLELGCGNGTYSKVLSHNAESVLATDLSEEMVKASKERLKAFSNVKVERADCFHLVYPENSFDTVFMANLIHIIPTPEKAIKECQRVLKNNGLLIITSYTPKGMKFYHKISLIYRYLRTYGKPPKGGWSFAPKDIEELLKSYGFHIIESELIGNKSKAIFVKAAHVQ